MARKAIVDLAHLSRTYWHASENQPLSTMLESSMDALWKVKGKNYDALFCAVDYPPYERTKVYPEYKANREGAGPVYFEQYRLLQERAQREGFRIVRSKGHEADDVIATLVQSDEWDIYTNDKDLLQLVGDKVTVVSTVDFSERGAAQVAEKFGVAPDQLGDWLALVGDSSDNIPGCPKVGAKTATKILAGVGTLKNLFELLKDGALPIGCTPQLAEVIKANKEQVEMSRTLVELKRDVEIEEKPMKKVEAAEIETETETTGGPLFTDADFEQASTQEPVEVAVASVSVRRDRAPAPIDSIELRPGVHLTAAKYELMKQLAKNFHDGGMYARKFSSAQAIFTVMMLGMELGVSPQVACQNFHFIEGRPAPAAHFLIALAKRDPDCLYLEMESETPEAVTYVTKKRSFPKELRFTYSVQDARTDQMKWASSSTKNHRAMLRKTAGSQAARLWYPEACNGLYSQEEMGFNSEEGE